MKKNVVLTIVLGSAVLFSSVSMAAGLHGCPAKNTIFSSYTEKHSKAVELCNLGNGQYRYSFGPVGKPEIVLKKLAREVQLPVGMGGGFSLDNGSYNYSAMVDKYGNGSLTVYKGASELADIALDVEGKGYVNNTFNY